MAGKRSVYVMGPELWPYEDSFKIIYASIVCLLDQGKDGIYMVRAVSQTQHIFTAFLKIKMLWLNT